MEKDDLIKQMTEYARIARANNPVLELDIKKCLDALPGMGCSPEEVSALGEALHHPEKLVWNLGPPLPEEPLSYEPTEEDKDFIRKLIDRATVWAVPSTGEPDRPETCLTYAIDRQNKTFKVIIDPEHDEHRIHDKTKMILSLLGWRMIDEQRSSLGYTAVAGPWAVGVFDFSIATQIDRRTGKNFPPGTRGQDSVATCGGRVVRLGQVIGRELIRHAQAPKSDIGAGKTAAPGQVLKEKYGRDDKK